MLRLRELHKKLVMGWRFKHIAFNSVASDFGKLDDVNSDSSMSPGSSWAVE